MAIRTVIVGSAAAPDGSVLARGLLPVAISATGRHMFLHFMAIGNALLSMHDIDFDMQSAMKQRLSAFQRMGFPLPERLKAKARIGIDDALKLVFAFELLEVGMTPSRAARLTTTDWTTIRDAIARTWRARNADPVAEPRLLVITPRALVDFGAKEVTTGQPLSETAGLFELSGGPLYAQKAAFSSVRIDVGAMAAAFGKALAGTGFSPEADFDRAMRLFADAVAPAEAEPTEGLTPVHCAPPASARETSLPAGFDHHPHQAPSPSR